MTTKEEDEDVEEEDQEEKKTKSEQLLTEALRKMAIDRREACNGAVFTTRHVFRAFVFFFKTKTTTTTTTRREKKFFLLFLQIVFTPRRESDRDDSNAETNQSRGVLRDRDLERVLCVTNLARRS